MDPSTGVAIYPAARRKRLIVATEANVSLNANRQCDRVDRRGSSVAVFGSRVRVENMPKRQTLPPPFREQEGGD